ELEESVASRGAPARRERRTALEQIDCRRYVVPCQCPAAGGGKQLARPLAERPGAVVEYIELLPEAAGLLEVIAEQLLPTLVELEPGGEALVQVGARPLRDPGVGGVPDQRMPEAEAVLSGNARDRRLDQLTAHEPEQRRPECLVATTQRADG